MVYANTLIDSVLVSASPDTVYTDTDVTNGQIYYYRITAVDSSGNESGFSLEDAAVPNETQGNAVSLDGDGDYIDVLFLFDPDSTDFSVEMWFQVADAAGVNDNLLSQKDGSGTGRHGWWWLLDRNNDGFIIRYLVSRVINLGWN